MVGRNIQNGAVHVRSDPSSRTVEEEAQKADIGNVACNCASVGGVEKGLQ